MDIQHLKRKLYAPWRYNTAGAERLGWVEANNRNTICAYVCPWAGAAIDMAPALLMSLARIAEIQPAGDRAGEIARRAIKEYVQRQAIYTRR